MHAGTFRDANKWCYGKRINYWSYLLVFDLQSCVTSLLTPWACHIVFVCRRRTTWTCCWRVTMTPTVPASSTWTTCPLWPRRPLLLTATEPSSLCPSWTDTTNQVPTSAVLLHLQRCHSSCSLASFILFCADLTREEAVDLLRKCVEEVSLSLSLKPVRSDDHRSSR